MKPKSAKERALETLEGAYGEIRDKTSDDEARRFDKATKGVKTTIGKVLKTVAVEDSGKEPAAPVDVAKLRDKRAEETSQTPASPVDPTKIVDTLLARLGLHRDEDTVNEPTASRPGSILKLATHDILKSVGLESLITEEETATARNLIKQYGKNASKHADDPYVKKAIAAIRRGDVKKEDPVKELTEEDIYDKIHKRQSDWDKKTAKIKGKRYNFGKEVWEFSGTNDIGVPYFRKVVKGRTQKKDFALGTWHLGDRKEWLKKQLKESLEEAKIRKPFRIPSRKELRGRDEAIARRLKEIMDAAKKKKVKESLEEAGGMFGGTLKKPAPPEIRKLLQKANAGGKLSKEDYKTLNDYYTKKESLEEAKAPLCPKCNKPMITTKGLTGVTVCKACGHVDVAKEMSAKKKKELQLKLLSSVNEGSAGETMAQDLARGKRTWLPTRLKYNVPGKCKNCGAKTKEAICDRCEKKYSGLRKLVKKESFVEGKVLKTAKCPSCGKDVTIPEVPVKRTGYLRCSCGKMFPYKGKALKEGETKADPKGVAFSKYVSLRSGAGPKGHWVIARKGTTAGIKPGAVFITNKQYEKWEKEWSKANPEQAKKERPWLKESQDTVIKKYGPARLVKTGLTVRWMISSHGKYMQHDEANIKNKAQVTALVNAWNTWAGSGRTVTVNDLMKESLWESKRPSFSNYKDSRAIERQKMLNVVLRGKPTSDVGKIRRQQAARKIADEFDAKVKKDWKGLKEEKAPPCPKCGTAYDNVFGKALVCPHCGRTHPQSDKPSKRYDFTMKNRPPLKEKILAAAWETLAEKKAQWFSGECDYCGKKTDKLIKDSQGNLVHPKCKGKMETFLTAEQLVEDINKALKKPPAADCIINTMFADANEPIKKRLEYCEKNCQWKCKKGKSYKKSKRSVREQMLERYNMNATKEDDTVEAVSATRSSKKEADVSQLMIQYTKRNNMFKPMGPITLVPTLQAHAYNIHCPYNSPPVFEKVEAKTDELLNFPNSVMENIIKEIDKFWTIKPNYEQLGFLHSRGILVYGPPGTGKSSLMQQVAELMVEGGDVVFFVRSVSEAVNGLKAFREIEPDRKALVVLEDIDEYISYAERNLLQLLSGDNSVDNVLYLGSTNYIQKFSPRLLRPGRFDKTIFLGPPPIEGRQAYLNHKLDGIETPAGIEFLAKQTNGLSFGHLRELVIGAYALREPVIEVVKRLSPTVNISAEDEEKFKEIFHPDRKIKGIEEVKEGAWGTDLKEPGKLTCPKCSHAGQQKDFIGFKAGRQRLCKKCAIKAGVKEMIEAKVGKPECRHCAQGIVSATEKSSGLCDKCKEQGVK